ncbi:MAG: FAD-dependent oxidoreductase [Spirochaetes bacterium]|nr:FAD-dependent oxidoreductase [Spirochaetota bacterium]
MVKDRNSRIGIVGAGAAGLSCALYLADSGYRRVVVLEKDRRPGGKCRSWREGGRTWELGAVLATADCSETLGIMKRVGVEPWRLPPAGDVPNGDFADRGFHPLEKTQLSRFKHSELPGTFGELARGLAGALVPRNDGIGEDTFFWKDGVQELWGRVASGLEVRYGAQVRGISRGPAVIVATDSGEFEFDQLILTSPLDEAAVVMDSTDEEKSLLSRVRTLDCRVLVCRIGDFGMPSGFAPGRSRGPGAGSRGRPMIWQRRHAGVDLFTFYVLAESGESDSEIEANVRKDVEAVGGRFVETAASARWKYFPHVDTDALRDVFPPKLEALQGLRRVWFAGELMSFSTIERTVRYSRDLVDRFFA